ncbi:MAG TPA: TonB-dependent receptor [Acidobacteriaceae bacterium]|nr:TonB-dependent receptor [Acidobacteriaceae bacterium]
MRRNTMLSRLSLLCCAFLLMAGVGLAQSTTQGAIAGTVMDASGAAVPSAAVTVHNTGTNADIHLTGDTSGYFKAPLLDPGTYTVTITAQGFGTDTETGVGVVVGQITTLSPKLKAGSESTTVSVSADAVQLNFETPDMTATLNQTALQNIPIQNKRWSALAMTTPGVVADSSGFGLVSVRGMSTLMNNVEVDGADDNQAYFSEERGRTREGYSTVADSMREFAVNTGVYSAQYGRAAGGVINSVTRSGTNQIHGDVTFNDLDRGFGAYVPGSIDASGHPLKPKDLRKIYGFSAGGPLLKDRLFWFYTYNQLTHINPGVSIAKNFGAPDGSTVGSFLEKPDASTPILESNCNQTTGYLNQTAQGAGAQKHSSLDNLVCTMGARLKLGTYAAAVAYYNNGVTGPGGLTSNIGIVPRAGYQEINSPKLDWQVNEKNRVSFLYNRLRWDAPGDVQTASTAQYALDAFGNDFVKLDYGIAKLESQLSQRMSNEVLYQYGRELNNEGQQPYSAYTLKNLVAKGGNVAGAAPNGPGGTIPYIGLQTSIGFNLGSPYYSYRISYPSEWKWQVEDILYYQLGSHSLRMGGDFVHNSDLLHQTPYYYGDYSYSSIPNFLTDVATNGGATQGTCNSSGSAGSATASGVGTYGCYSSMFQYFGATRFAMSTMDYAGFIQDNWKVFPRLTLELGVRYDYEALPAPPSNLTSATGSFVPYAGLTNAPSDKNNFGPRIGFSLDVFGSGNTVLRGGYGLYYGRVLNGVVASIQFGSGSPNGQFGTASLKPTGTGTTPQFPFPLAAGSGTKPSSFYLAPNLQNPQVHELDLQVQQNLGKGNIFQVSYLGALGRELPNYLDVNLAPPQFTEYVQATAGPIAGTLTAVPTFGSCPSSAPTCNPYPTGYLNTNFGNITELISNINSSYNGLVFEIQNRSVRGLQFDANYTWAHALDFNQNASSTTSTNNWLNPYASARDNYGTSQFNVGNRFVGYVVYTLPNLHSGSALKYLTNEWTVGNTFQMQNGLPFSAQIGSGFNSAAALNSSWNGAPSVFYIPVIGINTYQVPRAIVDDMRLQKGFRFTERFNLLLQANMYNVANHQNFTTSEINQNVYNFASGSVGSQTTPAQLTYLPTTFQSRSGSNNSGFLYTPREFEIGARLEF